MFKEFCAANDVFASPDESSARNEAAERMTNDNEVKVLTHRISESACQAC